MRNHVLAQSFVSWQLFVFALLAAFSLPASADDLKRTYGDWQFVCTDDACRIRQGLTNPEQPGIVYGSELQFAADGNQLVLTLSFPLGIYLPRGIGLTAGDQRRDAPMTVCLPDGCKAIILVDAALSAALGSESAFSVRVYITDERPVEIEFSLAGYPLAYQQMANSR